MTGLGLFLVALIVCLLVYSSAIYYAELGIHGSQIHSIPDAFWWAIITMTTAATTTENVRNTHRVTMATVRSYVDWDTVIEAR